MLFLFSLLRQFVSGTYRYRLSRHCLYRLLFGIGFGRGLRLVFGFFLGGVTVIVVLGLGIVISILGRLLGLVRVFRSVCLLFFRYVLAISNCIYHVSHSRTITTNMLEYYSAVSIPLSYGYG